MNPALTCDLATAGPQTSPAGAADSAAGGSALLLLGAVERLAGAASIDDIVATLRSAVRPLIGADGIAVILRKDEQCWDIDEDAMGPRWTARKLPLASCISSWAMLNKRTVVIENVRHDPRVPKHLCRDTFVRSLLMVPVCSVDPIGAIGAYWNECHHSADAEVAIMERLARATATATENVRLVSALSKALSDAELARDELRHRVKNAYSAAQALAALTVPPEYHRALNARIAAFVRGHDLLDEQLSHRESIAIDELILGELTPYTLESPGRLTLEGERILLPSPRATALGLAISELATNALKYGALSTPAGRVDVRWRVSDGHVLLQWRECDGPEVRATGIENFGSRVLRRLVEGQLQGSIRRELDSKGVTCVLEFPCGIATVEPQAAQAAQAT